MSTSKTKICCTCRKDKPLSDFYRLKSRADGRYPNCKDCYKKSRTPRQESIRAGRRDWNKRIRLEAIYHYGGKCRCCGEKQIEFLAIDHIQGGGRQHRKEIKTPLPYWLKRNGFPKGFRILCHNCNMSLGRYGYCPHTRAAI